MNAVIPRKRWLSVLAGSSAKALSQRWQSLNLAPQYSVVRAPEIGLTRLQARIGATGKRFVMGDMTITRAVIRLENGICGYSYVSGRDKDHAERCAIIDAMLQQPEYHDLVHHHIIAPLAEMREADRQQRAREVASSKVDFFTLVRGENE